MPRPAAAGRGIPLGPYRIRQGWPRSGLDAIHTFMRFPAALCRLLPLAAALACGGSLEPETVSGVWYLQAYNDSTVPGIAVFRAGNDSSLVAIDSLRLGLSDDATCTWLVDLADEGPSGAESCIWTLDAAPDDLLVDVNAGFELRGDASEDELLLRDLNGNRLRFGRDPSGQGPIDPGGLLTSRR